MASQSTLSVLASSASSSSAPPLLSPPSPRLVRFQEQCALIPELSVLVAAKSPPRVMTKSLSLPVLNLQLPWKRSSVAFPKQPSNPERNQRHAQSVQSSPPVVIKVPVPIFRRKSLSPLGEAGSRALPPCLVHRHDPKLPSFSTSICLPNAPTSPPKGSTSKPRGRPMRSASLPTPSMNVETIPLRPCCTNCFAACNSLPPLAESSQESNNTSLGGSADDWCSGVHFTKGALRRRRSASMEGEGFHATMLRVDEVDRRHQASKSTPCANPKVVQLKAKKRESRTSDNGSVDSAQDDDDSELFPLPSPKRTPTGSPSPSPSASTQNLVGLPSGKLEATIREKIAQRAREKEEAQLLASDSGKFLSSATSPIFIPCPSSKSKHDRPTVSHFRSHTDEIEYDDSLPDPDALPPDSTICLNSPPSSPPFQPSSPNASATMTSLSLSSSPPSSPGLQDTPKKRRPSMSAGVVGIVHAGVGVLRGISLSSSSSIAV